MTKQLITFGTAILVTVLGLLLLWQFRLVFVYVLFSLALAAAIRPLSKRLAGGRSRVKRLGLLLLFLLALGGFAVAFVLSVAEAAGEVQRLAGQVAVQDEWQQPEWLAGTAFQEVLDQRLPAPSVLFGALIGDQGQLVLPTLFGFTQNIISVISAALVILFLSIYWSIDQVHFERLWLSLLPVGWRTRVRDIWRTTEPELGAYIRNAALRSILAGLVLGLGYWTLGSPYPALLALIGALALLIPMVGVALAVIAPLLVGLLTSVQLGLFTVLLAVVVLVALKLWIEPRLFRSGHYNPILTIVILMALADAFGLIGLIVAPPLAVVCQILWSRLVARRTVSGAAGQISDLKERQVQVKTVVAGMESPPPLVTSSLERLTKLLEQAESTLAVPPPV